MIRNGLLAFAGIFFASFAQPAASQVPPLSYDWVVNIRNESSVTLPAGSSAGYVVTVFNDSLASAPATTISIPVPAGTTWDGASGTISGCAEAVAGTVSCTVPALGPDGDATLTINFLTTAEGVIAVTPTIPAPDADPSNNSETITTTITKGADIALSLSGTTTVPSGGVATYTFTATNTGPYPSQGFTLDFPVPAGLSGIVPPAGCVLFGGSYQCVVGPTVPIGGTVDFTFSGTATVGANSTITLSGSVSDGSPPDPDASNDIASFNTSVTAGSDVAVTKTRLPGGSLVVGDTVAFTLSPRYSGDVPTGLTMTDTLPSNYSVVSVTPSPSSGWLCSTSGQTVTCTLASGTVPGFNVPLGPVVIVADVVAAGSAINVVNIDATDPFDPDLSNNTGDDGGVVIIPPTIDLAVRKSGPEPPLVVVGNSYDYRLGASNEGTTASSGRSACRISSRRDLT